MSNPHEIPTEREEIEMLLPWYVTGKLDAADKARVETYMAREPAMRRQLELIRDEQSATIAAHEAITAPRTLTVERSMQAVAANTSLGWRQASDGMLGRIREFFVLPTARGVRLASIAAAAIVLLQTAAIVALLPRNDGYVTASGSTTDAATAIVAFVDGASAQAVAKTLEQLNMTIVDGPKPGGTFVIRIGPKGLSKAERDMRIAELRKATGVVRLVLP